MGRADPRYRVELWKAVIAAAGTLLVGVIGFILKNNDFNRLKQDVGGVSGVSGRWHITGRIAATPARRPFTIYLVPGNRLMTTTDDSGFFSIDDVPAGSYQVLIRDEARTAMSSVIEPGHLKGQLDLNDARAQWEVAETGKNAAARRDDRAVPAQASAASAARYGLASR
jgi:hypothetical protein